MVIEARRCSFTAGAKRFVLWKSQSTVFCRNPHDRFIRSETSETSADDGDDDVNGIVGKSIVNFGLQIENERKKLSNFENIFSANFLSTLMRSAREKAAAVALVGHCQLCPMDRHYTPYLMLQMSFLDVSVAPWIEN